MTETNRYLTCGVDNTIPLELQLFLWDCVDRLPEPKDYLQVFELRPMGTMQSILCISSTSRLWDFMYMRQLSPS